MKIRKSLLALLLMGSLVLSSDRNFPKGNRVEVVKGLGTVYPISREQAEKQMYSLAKRAEKEDAWAYLEDKLIDIGTKERGNQVCSNHSYLKHLIKKNSPDTIYFYHIHPAKTSNGCIDPPTSSDFKAHLDRKRYFIENPMEVFLVSKVADKNGIWTYGDKIPLKSSKEKKPISVKFIIGLDGAKIGFPEELSKQEKIEEFIRYVDSLGKGCRFQFME